MPPTNEPEKIEEEATEANHVSQGDLRRRGARLYSVISDEHANRARPIHRARNMPKRYGERNDNMNMNDTTWQALTDPTGFMDHMRHQTCSCFS